MKKDREISTIFGQVIKNYRQKNGLSLRDLSEKTNISESYLSRLENSNKLAPSYKVIESICQGLKIDVGDMISILKDDKSKDTLKTLDFIIITNDFTLDGKKRATRKQKEEIVELIEFIFDADSPINNESKKVFDDMHKILRIIVDIKND